MARQTPVPPELIGRLISALQYHARKAIELALGEWSFLDGLDLAYRAGAVVELLAKVVLARCDQRLLAKQAHEHLLDALSGIAAREANLRTTLDASVAVGLAAQVDPRVAASEKEARAVLAARNDAVHLAVAPTAGHVKAVVAQMVAAVEALLAAGVVDSREFWGSQHAAATSILRSHLDSVAVEARSLVTKAQQAHRQLLAGLLDDARQTVMRSFRPADLPNAADVAAGVAERDVPDRYEDW